MLKEGKPSELKPCPFCLNETPKICSDGGCRLWSVNCFGCNCTKHAPPEDDTRSGVIKSWNRRVIIEG